MPLVQVNTDEYYIVKRSTWEAHQARERKNYEKDLIRLEKSSSSPVIKEMFHAARVESEKISREKRDGMKTRSRSIV
jgi:hypothetical protein